MTDAPRPKSFQDILQQNQDFIAHLQTLQDDAASQLTDKEKELAATRAQLDATRQALDENQKELAAVRAQLDAGQRAHGEKQKELDDLQNAQLQWAIDRQGLLDPHDALKQSHQDLQGSHDRARTELNRLQEDVTRSKTRDEERRAQLRQLEQERMQLTQKYEADQKKVTAELSALKGDLDSLQSAQLEWAMDRESLLKDRDATVRKQAELEQEWQKARAILTEDKNRLAALNTQINQQLRAVQAALDPLKAAREKWQAERQRLIADVARLEQESQAKDSEYRADRKLLQTDLDEARKKAAELGKVQGELQRLGEERTALLAKVKALEKDWQAREASYHEERAGLRKQLQDASAKLQGMQQDYEKVKSLHADLAGETGRKAEEWTAREQRLTSEKNQLKVDLERIQAQLSEMMNQTNELQNRRQSEAKELEVAWQREKTTLKAQLDEARKAAGTTPPQSQVLARYEAEKRALQAQVDGLRVELTASGKSKDVAPALAQAKRDFEAKFRVIYDQSHDLNSPLNAVIGFSEILLDERTNKTTPEERHEFVSHINESGKRLMEHIRELIEFAKQESGIQERPVQLQPPVGMGNSKPPVILVADDDPQNIRLVKAMLKPFNMEVLVADGGKAGVELALKKKPDMIILDLMMPDVDGFEVVSKLRDDPTTAQIPILIYTAKNITSEDRERLQGNIQTIIQKGDFGKDRFLEMINNLQTPQAA